MFTVWNEHCYRSSSICLSITSQEISDTYEDLTQFKGTPFNFLTYIWMYRNICRPHNETEYLHSIVVISLVPMVGSGAALRSFFQFQWFYQKWSMGKVGQRAAHTSKVGSKKTMCCVAWMTTWNKDVILCPNRSLHGMVWVGRDL